IAALVLADVVRALITMALPLRMVMSAAIVFVFGLVMGVMLPLGVHLIDRRDPELVPWAWGVNGGTSVIGTVGATVIAINAGVGTTFLVGAGLYIAAGAIGWSMERSSTAVPAPAGDEKAQPHAG